MKKKIILLFTCLLFLICVACSNKKNDERTLTDFTKAYQDNGVEITGEDKPYFSMIGAEDGTLFYIDQSVVKIYMYSDEDALKKAQDDYSDVITGWDTNGKFLLETNNEQAKEIFKEIAEN